MGEMKNLKPGDKGWNFMQLIEKHNETLKRKEAKLWSMIPDEVQDKWGWFYANRYLLWYIDDNGLFYHMPVDRMKGLWIWDAEY